jgi:3-hydroxybutyryl-CoA dehydrogenase
MAAAIMSARQALRLSSRVRYFSSTAARPAAEVKRLGVIGAGQMVSSPFPFLLIAFS